MKRKSIFSFVLATAMLCNSAAVAATFEGTGHSSQEESNVISSMDENVDTTTPLTGSEINMEEGANNSTISDISSQESQVPSISTDGDLEADKDSESDSLATSPATNAECTETIPSESSPSDVPSDINNPSDTSAEDNIQQEQLGESNGNDNLPVGGGSSTTDPSPEEAEANSPSLPEASSSSDTSSETNSSSDTPTEDNIQQEQLGGSDVNETQPAGAGSTSTEASSEKGDVNSPSLPDSTPTVLPDSELQQTPSESYEEPPNIIEEAPVELDNIVEADSEGNVIIIDSELIDFVIPSYINETEVVCIGSYAFANCDLFKTVIIPETVTYIGDYAFDNCINLERIIFEGRANLDNVELGDGWNGTAEIEFGLVEVVIDVEQEIEVGPSEPEVSEAPFESEENSSEENESSSVSSDEIGSDENIVEDDTVIQMPPELSEIESIPEEENNSECVDYSGPNSDLVSEPSDTESVS